jgi:hypothetical protein
LDAAGHGRRSEVRREDRPPPRFDDVEVCSLFAPDVDERVACASRYKLW